MVGSDADPPLDAADEAGVMAVLNEFGLQISLTAGA